MKKEKRIKEIINKVIKLTIASAVAIIAAMLLGLEYPASAGIITILSIQNTKKETLKTAANRGMAFVCALIIAYVCFHILGYNIGAFSIYILIFSFICLYFKWPEAIAMDSVLITHFWSAESMNFFWLCNEIKLFAIGILFGIIANVLLKRKGDKFAALADEVDNEIKRIMNRMSEKLVTADKSGYNSDCFPGLREKLENARVCAMDNWNNSLYNNSEYEIDYVEMREQQTAVLENIYNSIIMVSFLPDQAVKVSEFISRIVSEYHKDNNVEELLLSLNEVFEYMKKEELPKTREEFEARAVLFYILKQLEEFLTLKRDFAIKYIDYNYK